MIRKKQDWWVIKSDPEANSCVQQQHVSPLTPSRISSRVIFPNKTKGPQIGFGIPPVSQLLAIILPVFSFSSSWCYHAKLELLFTASKMPQPPSNTGYNSSPILQHKMTRQTCKISSENFTTSPPQWPRQAAPNNPGKLLNWWFCTTVKQGGAVITLNGAQLFHHWL